MYFQNEQIQQKDCKFLIRIKNGEQWETLENFMDFSEFGTNEKIGKENSLEIKFAKNIPNIDFKDAVINCKFQIVAFDKDDKKQEEWIQQSEKKMAQVSTLASYTNALPDVYLETQKEEDKEEEVYTEESVEKYPPQKFRVIF